VAARELADQRADVLMLIARRGDDEDVARELVEPAAARVDVVDEAGHLEPRAPGDRRLHDHRVGVRGERDERAQRT
jgi:hypothetical protein